jgi:pSer/pThr/pTyr-binding forkhead associated (FHA) protein
LPTKVQLLNIIGVLLQYSLVVLLYYFLFQVLRAVYRDLKAPRGEPFVQPAPAPEGADDEARLTVVEAGAVALKSSVYPLGETVSIGRGEGNDIVVAENFVSHEHALITRYKHAFWLTDLNSTNGTFHNNRRVTDEVLLQDGDLITVGAVTFRFER